MIDKRAARAGGMPLYKWLGNQILTRFQNRMLGTQLSEFHSGYRLYSTDALAQIPFEKNTNDFHFDTEIIIQFVLKKLRIVGTADSDILWRRNLPRKRTEIRLGHLPLDDQRAPVRIASVLRPKVRRRPRTGRSQRQTRFSVFAIFCR